MPAAAVVESMVSSLMMVLTASDPPHLAWHSAPLLTAAAIAVLALLGAPGFRNAPLALVLFFLAGCSSALVTRGWAYEGRFSFHLLGAAGALCAWGLSAIARRLVQVWYSPVHPEKSSRRSIIAHGGHARRRAFRRRAGFDCARRKRGSKS